MATLKVERMLELKDLEWWLEAEKKNSQEVFSIAEEVKARHQKRQNDLETTKRQIEEMEQALAIVRTRETELSQAVEASRTEVNMADD